MRLRSALILSLCILPMACSGPNIGPNVRSGTGAYDVIPAPEADQNMQDYVIGPLDRVDITVFQEADISSKGLLVDASGNISMPLIGRVQATGRTTTQLADDVARTQLEEFIKG